MARPIPDILTQGIEGWDAEVNSNFDLIFEGPIPIKVFATVGGLPAAGSFDDCLAYVAEAGFKRRLFVSDGATWFEVNPQEPRKLSTSVGAEVPDVITFSLQIQDEEENDLAERRAIKVWMAETAFGAADATALNSMVVVAPAIKFFNHATEYAEFMTHTDGSIDIDVDVTGGKTKHMVIDTGFGIFTQAGTWAA